jgi:hypothetical protein
MKSVRLGVLLGAFLLVPLPGVRAQAEVPASALEVLRQYDEEAAEADRKADVEVKKRVEKTAAELKRIQDEFCKDLKLDEAVAVRDAARRLVGTGDSTPADDLPAAARAVLKAHDEGVAEITRAAEAGLRKSREKTLEELQKQQDLFCRQAKLDEAVAIRDLIRALKEGRGAAQPDPGYINNPPTDVCKVFYYETTGAVTGGAIYGTDVYTTGSHLAMASVHSGVLRPGQRGVVRVTILPGRPSYAATTANGITSHAYGQWGVSFKVERVYVVPGKGP